MANYTYREDGISRIFDGNFLYKSADGKKCMAGKYANDMKIGLWKTDWYGFHEETNYKQGLKHGIYRVRYKDSNNEMKIDAHFTQGNIDSLDFWMQTPGGRIIAGRQHSSPKIIDKWLYGIEGKYVRTQYFYKGFYVGYTDYDHSTGNWGEFTIEDIKKTVRITDTLIKNDYKHEGDCYTVEPQKENIFYKKLLQNGNLFSNEPCFFNEIAYFFIYDFHTACFGPSLWRGEVFESDYTLCYLIKEDGAKKAEKARKEKEHSDSIAKKTAEFAKTEYGRLINYLKPFAEKSDSLFNMAKRNYIDNILSKYCLATRPTYILDNNVLSLNFKYSEGDKDWSQCKFITQLYQINVPNGLKDFSVLVFPTALALDKEQWCVSDAIIVYYNGANKGSSVTSQFKSHKGVDLQQTNLYLQYYYNEMKLGQKGYIAQGTRVSITDNYVFNAYSQNCIMQPITSDTKYKKTQIYYDSWHNPRLSTDDFIQSITKEEVMKSIEERFNIKKEE